MMDDPEGVPGFWDAIIIRQFEDREIYDQIMAEGKPEEVAKLDAAEAFGRKNAMLGEDGFSSCSYPTIAEEVAYQIGYEAAGS